MDSFSAWYPFIFSNMELAALIERKGL